MKISLFQGILIGVFILSAVIGLIVFTTYKGSGTKDAIGTVVIWGTLPTQGMTAMLTSVAQGDQTLKSVSYVRKDPATLANDLAAAIATGGSPDLVLASQEELLSLSKFISVIPKETLSESTFINTFTKEGNLFETPGGSGYYGVPFLVDPLVLFSNRTILSSAGIARPPMTWEALAGLVSQVATFTPTRQVTRGLIGLGSYDNVHNARAILSTLFLQMGVPVASYGTSGEVRADLGRSGASGVPRGRSVLGFYTQFADPAKVSYTWNASLPDSRQMFVTGDLALYLGFASEAAFLKASNPSLDFLVTPVPQPATATAKNVYGLLYAFMVPRGAKNPSGGYSVAALFSGTSQQAAAALNTGLAPATLNQLESTPANPIAAVAYSEALYASGWLSPAAASVDQLFSGMINSVITGRKTFEDSLNSTEQLLNALLQP